ncbi:MAG TPA: nucleoside hydrolase, partial [Gemmataceae bacterium]|nr:nucleoside hydrolase [Gemmataceae bacterium]
VLPGALTTRSVAADVELRGELTRGMSVFDVRWGSSTKHNLELATGVDVAAVRQYIQRILSAE